MFELKLAARLCLCRKCLCFRGPFYDDFNGCERVLPCGCDPKQPLWKGYDYNDFAELCHCCAAAVVSSGSRWSPYFCDDCKPCVRAYNEEVGFCAIPLGRHSMMNGVALPATAATKRPQVEKFVTGLFGFIGRAERLGGYHVARVRRILGSLAEPPDAVPVQAYLAHAKAVSGDGDAIFAELVSAMNQESN
jgi:hypothetical protein